MKENHHKKENVVSFNIDPEVKKIMSGYKEICKKQKINFNIAFNCFLKQLFGIETTQIEEINLQEVNRILEEYQDVINNQ